MLIKPILSAILADIRNENAVRTPAIENMYDSRVNLVKNQSDTMLCITKPPAKESIANKADSLPTIFFDFGDRGFVIFLLFSYAAKSLVLLIEMHLFQYL